MKASTRYLIVALGVPLLVALVAAVAVVLGMDRLERQNEAIRLRDADAIVDYLRQSRLSALQARAEGLAGDTAFVDYVGQSMTPTTQAGGADEASISDLLSERRGAFDAMMVLGPDGKPVGRAGVLLRDRASIPQDPLVVQASTDLKQASGAWVDNGELQWVTVDPLLRGRTLQGMLLTATRVDTSFVSFVGRATGSSVALIVQGDQPPRVVATNDAGSAVGQSMATFIDRIDAGRSPEVVFHAADGDHEGRIVSLPAVAGHAVLLIASTVGHASTSIPDTAWPFLGGIVVMLGLAWIAAIAQWRRTYVPLQHLVDVARLAAGGDYRVHARSAGSHMAVALRDALNELIGRMRG